MKSRDVVGRRIVRLDQSRVNGEYAINSLALDNGTAIVFVAIEHPDGADPYVVAWAVKSVAS